MEKKNNEKLKIALIGGGVNSSIGPTHIAALNSSQDWDITCGIFGKKEKLLPRLLNKSSTKIYNSIHSLLKSEKNKLNAFLLLTPPQENKKIIEQIKKTRIPIISEKPVFDDLKKLKNMRNYFYKNNIKFLSTYNYSYFPALQELKYLVNSEKSKLNKIIIEIPQQGFFLKIQK